MHFKINIKGININQINKTSALNKIKNKSKKYVAITKNNIQQN